MVPGPSPGPGGPVSGLVGDQHRKDEVALVPVFVAFVPPEIAVRLGPEHNAHEWLTPAEAGARFAWPRERRALEDAVQLLGSGDGGAVEDVLRIC